MIITINCPSCSSRFDANITLQNTETVCAHCGDAFHAASVLTEQDWERLSSEQSAPGMVTSTNHVGGRETFGQFEIIRELSKNDVWVTYRAFDSRRQKVVTLRVLVAEDEGSEAEARRISMRLEKAQDILHPNLAQVFEVDYVEGICYVASEYVEGERLVTLAERDVLPMEQVLGLMLDLAEAIDLAHAEGLRHGSIDPNSVLVDNNGVPKIVDLGLGRDPARVDRPVNPGRPAIMPAYSPPERLAGREPTSAADVYGLGCLLYHVVTGRPPFVASDPLQLLMKIEQTPPIPPSEISPNLAADVEHVILKCLEKNPADRYVTVRALCSELARLIDGEPVRARPVPSARRFVRRAPHGLAVLITIASFAAASVGAVYYTYSAALDPSVALRRQLRQAMAAAQTAHPSAEALKNLQILAASEKLPWNERALAHAAIGRVYAVNGNKAAAAASYSLAIELFTRNGPRSQQLGRLHVWRGFSRYAMEDYGGAIADFNAAIGRGARESATYYALGMARWHASVQAWEDQARRDDHLKAASRAFQSAVQHGMKQEHVAPLLRQIKDCIGR